MVGTAGAGSLILEFGTLSRLTGDDRFEKAAYKAFFAIWNSRSDLGLVGNSVNIFTGVSIIPVIAGQSSYLLQAWTHPEISNVGAGIDSFYEYALKWYILSGELALQCSEGFVHRGCAGEVEFLDVFQEAYAAVMRYSRAPDGFWVSDSSSFIRSFFTRFKSIAAPTYTRYVS